jgi:hypothetical protein
MPTGSPSRLAPAKALLLLLLGLTVAGADDAQVRVKGYFCNAQADQVAFLSLQAQGENEEMAANAVNKSIAKFSCAYYRPATAVQTGEKTVMENGLVFKVQSFLFFPEKVERWTGTVFGSLQPAHESNI